jgi:hypothetical protein
MTAVRLPRVGVCVIRVEVSADHTVITVTVNRNISRSLQSAQPDETHRFVDREATLAEVARFLDSLQVKRQLPLSERS